MAEPFPGLSGGAAGKVRWDHFNRMFRAVEKVEADAVGDPSGIPRHRSFWAKLLVLSGGTWTWEKVQYDGATSATATGLATSAMYASGGKATDPAGTATANSIVLLHEIPGSDGTKYYFVVSGGGGSTSSPYVIQSSSSLGGTPERWRYVLKIGEILTASTGIVTTVSGATAVYAYNLSEDTGGYQHGQDMTPGTATLTPSACTGVVMAWDSGVDYSGSDVYLFDAVNPETVTCGAASAVAGVDAVAQFLLMGA